MNNKRTVKPCKHCALPSLAEFAAWHRGCIWEQLNGFQGYDCLRFKPAPEENGVEVDPVPEKWIDWKGGTCPVPFGTKVMYRMDNHSGREYQRGLEFGPLVAACLNWDAEGASKVTAYKVVA